MRKPVQLHIPAGESSPGRRDIWRRGAVLAGFALVSVDLVSWHLHYSMMLFSGMDSGLLINSAWQLYEGAVPYHDFPTPYPPLFLLPAGWAFRLWGPAWSSFSILLSLFSLLTFAWMFALLWRMTRRPWPALVGSLAIQILSLLPLSWWWYNEITAMVAALFYASLCGLYAQPGSRLFRISFVLSGALLGLAKANVAAPLLFLGVIFLLFQRPLRRFVLLATLTAAVADVGVLALNHISVLALLQNYVMGGSGRLDPRMWAFFLEHPRGWQGRRETALWLVTILATAGAVFFAPTENRQKKAEALALFGIAVVVGVMGAIANYADKSLNIVFLVVLLYLLSSQRAASRSNISTIARWLGGVAICLCVALNLWAGSTRKYFEEFGSDGYFEPSARFTVTNMPLLNGMQVGDVTVQSLQNIGFALKDLGWSRASHKTVYFGTFIDFGYAAFHIPPPRSLPLWWENVPSTLPPKPHRNEGLALWRYPLLPRDHALDPRVQKFFDAKFDICFFWIDHTHQLNMEFVPEDIRHELFSGDYTVKYYETIVAFTRKAR